MSTARARTTDPATSHQAAASVTDLTTKQQAVLDCIHRLGPLTDRGLVQTYEALRARNAWPAQSESGLRTRRSELVDLGHITSNGTTRLSSGRKAHLWGRPGPQDHRLYPEARRAVQRRRRAS